MEIPKCGSIIMADKRISPVTKFTSTKERGTRSVNKHLQMIISDQEPAALSRHYKQQLSDIQSTTVFKNHGITIPAEPILSVIRKWERILGKTCLLVFFNFN